MSPNTTPSAPTIRAALALLWSWAGWAASVTDDGLVLSEAIKVKRRQVAAARRFAPPPFACQRAKYRAVAAKMLDLCTGRAERLGVGRRRRGSPWPWNFA